MNDNNAIGKPEEELEKFCHKASALHKNHESDI